MSVIAAALRELIAAGITGDQLVMAIERIEKAASPQRTKHAEAQARYREKNKNKSSQVITGDQRDHNDHSDEGSQKKDPPHPLKENTYSDPNGSGDTAPNSALAGDVIVFANPRADLFGRGLKILTGLTGKPEGQLRGLLGRWLKVANDDAVKVLRTIEDAARDKRAEPVSWIEAALKSKAPAGSREAFLKRGLI